MRYNCYWVYSVLPNRIEFQVTDRETGDILFDKVLRKFVEPFTGEYNDETMVAEIKPYVRIYDYKTIEHRNTTNYVGKGTYIGD